MAGQSRANQGHQETVAKNLGFLNSFTNVTCEQKGGLDLNTSPGIVVHSQNALPCQWLGLATEEIVFGGGLDFDLYFEGCGLGDITLALLWTSAYGGWYRCLQAVERQPLYLELS